MQTPRAFYTVQKVKASTKHRFLMNHKFSTLALALSLLGTASCNDFLDQYSQDRVVAKSVQDLNELLVGDVYLKSEAVNKGVSANTYGFINILDDDINTTGTSQQGNIGNTAWTQTVAPMYGYFTWQQDVRYNYGRTNKNNDDATIKKLYTRINHVNNIVELIENMPHATQEDDALYHRVKGEALFVRSQFYFTLANLYGRPYRLDSANVDLCVPLKLTSYVEHQKDKETQFSRATNAEVYAQMAKDLETAASELTTAPQPDRFRLHRASAEAANLLLSRVYLYMQRWNDAEKAARKVVQSPRAKLTPIAALQSGKPFLTRNNPEILFTQGSNYLAATDRNTSLTGAPADYCVTQELYDLFSEFDARRNAFFSKNSLSDSLGLTNKYERTNEANHVSDGFTLRTAEAYLNLAEALVMQGKEAEANSVLHQLQRQRIDDKLDDRTGEELVNEIRNERRRELCFEGHRWFDLRRYSVLEKHPLHKTVVHAFNAYTEQNSFLTTHLFTLPSGDAAYTFSLPESFVSFDKVPMPNNLRPERIEVKKPRELPELPKEDEEGDNTDTPNSSDAPSTGA